MLHRDTTPQWTSCHAGLPADLALLSHIHLQLSEAVIKEMKLLTSRFLDVLRGGGKSPPSMAVYLKSL